MIAEGFVANAAKVYICSRKFEAIQATADALTRQGIPRGRCIMAGPGVCIAIQAELSSYEGCVKLVTDLESKEQSTSFLIV